MPCATESSMADSWYCLMRGPVLHIIKLVIEICVLFCFWGIIISPQEGIMQNSFRSTCFSYCVKILYLKWIEEGRVRCNDKNTELESL